MERGCLSDAEVVALLERRRTSSSVDAEARSVVPSVEAHLAACAACRDLVASLGEDEPILSDDARASGDRSAGVDLATQLLVAQARGLLGTTLKGKWTLDALVGVGGMAQVFAATHRNGRRVAIKILRPELAVVPEIVRRFVREGYVANRANHSGTVAILDDDVAEDGAPFLVMELLEGETLAQRVTRGPLDLDDALRVADELLDVVASAHREGIVHRDLKPENVFVTRAGEIKVLDFGIARLRDALADDGARTASQVTMGTPRFMPPEQARGRTDEVDARSDVWALAATIVALVATRPLRPEATVQELLVAAMTTPAPKVSTLCPSLPGPVAEVLDRALAFEPAARFADASAFRVALAEARGGHAAGAVEVARALDPPSPARRSPLAPGRRAARRARLARFAIPVGLAVAAAGVWVAVRDGERTRSRAVEPDNAEPRSRADAAVASGTATTAAAPTQLPAPSSTPSAETSAPRPPVHGRGWDRSSARGGDAGARSQPPASATATPPALDPLGPRL